MILTVVSFFIILSILVLIHELGHFLMARFIGVEVEEFGLGLPPRAFGKKIGKTIYSINWLPIGGFVKLKGEDDEGTHPDIKGQKAKGYFWARSKKERSFILLSGVSMNFLLAVFITTYLLVSGILEPAGRVHLETVVEGTPAKTAGLVPNDIISSIEFFDNTSLLKQKKDIIVPSDLIETTKKHVGEEIILIVNRNENIITIPITPRKDYPEGQGPMGISISDLEIVKYDWYQAPVFAVKINIQLAWQMINSIGQFIWRLFTFTKVENYDVAGPIGIAQVTGKAVKIGFRATLEFMSLLSLNLAILNIMPFPALDGGRLMFVLLEKIIGKRVRPTYERITHQIGMIILLALVLLVSINDIIRIARGG